MDKEMVKELESELIIRFQDCDPFGHLNNAKYLDYFFNARADQTLLYYGWSPLKLSQEFDAHWVVTHHQISYLRPAMFGETVVVKTSLIYFDHNSITTECQMLNQEKNGLKAMIWTTLRNVSMQTGKSAPHSATLNQLLERMIIPDTHYTPLGFNDRLEQLKAYYKSLRGEV
jgi:acyl-CoA thioester hydrolase